MLTFRILCLTTALLSPFSCGADTASDQSASPLSTITRPFPARIIVQRRGHLLEGWRLKLTNVSHRNLNLRGLGGEPIIPLQATLERRKRAGVWKNLEAAGIDVVGVVYVVKPGESIEFITDLSVIEPLKRGDELRILVSATDSIVSEWVHITSKPFRWR